MGLKYSRLLYLLAVYTIQIKLKTIRANCWWEQENGSRRASVPVQERKTWLVAPVGELKPYRNTSCRGLVPIGRWNTWALIPVGNSLAQGIYWRRGFVSIGEQIPQGSGSHRGFIRVGDCIPQGIIRSRGLVSIGRRNMWALAPVGDLFKQGTYLNRGLVRGRDSFFYSLYLGGIRLLLIGYRSRLYILWKYKAYIGWWGIGT